MAEFTAADLAALREDIADLRKDVKAMTAALERLARLEEKHANARQDIDSAFNDIRDLKKTVSALELAHSARKSTNALLDKGIYAALGALGIFVLKKLGVM